MIPLAIDSLGPWGFVLLGLYLVAVAVYLAFFYGAGRTTRAEREQQAERLETEGSWEDFLALRTERRARAERRHSERRAA